VIGLDAGWETGWLATVGGDAEFRLISRWTDVNRMSVARR
jgi:hypothetical protein